MFYNVGCPTSRKEKILKVGVCGRPQKQSIFGTNNCSKTMTYTVLKTLSREYNFEISELRCCKTIS